MKSTLADINRRRAWLVTRAAAQREELACLTRSWRAPFALADRGVAFIQVMRRHPLALSFAAAVLARIVFGKQRAWIKHIWSAWKVARRITF